MPASRLIVLTALFLTLAGNRTFFAQVLGVYPLSAERAFFLLSVAAILFLVSVLLLALVAPRPVLKPVLSALLLLSALTGYFIDSYHTVIDKEMLINVLQTDPGEVRDLLSGDLFLAMLLFGVLPSLYVWKVRIRPVSRKRAVLARSALVALGLLGPAVLIAAQSKAFASFFREHKILRHYANPWNGYYAAGELFAETVSGDAPEVRPIGLDARPVHGSSTRKLVIFVVGESARADHFSLNGYRRETNPRLAREEVFSFSRFTSSGTSTAVSVPRMFSSYRRTEASMRMVEQTESLLDVLQHAGVHVLWRDNNSSSKDVADRVEYEDYKSAATNPVFDEEARDEGMLVGLQERIDGFDQGDILIVLHQMGCHGPDYYKRYPPAFEHFVPVCRTNQLDECTDEEINNAYDNIILYTDHFLAEAIELLPRNDEAFATALLYISDHGESLGENRLYLHGYPYSFAPSEQTHVPAILWFGTRCAVDRPGLEARRDDELSHDYVFHTVLDLLEIETSLYDPQLDLLRGLTGYAPGS